MDFSARRWDALSLSLSVEVRPVASLTGLRRDLVRIALAAWREDVRADEFEMEGTEFVPDMMDCASEALSEFIPGVRVAAKSLQEPALVNEDQICKMAHGSNSSPSSISSPAPPAISPKSLSTSSELSDDIPTSSSEEEDISGFRLEVRGGGGLVSTAKAG